MSWMDSLKKGLNVAGGAMQGMTKPTPYAQIGQQLGDAGNTYRSNRALQKGTDQSNDAVKAGIDQSIRTTPPQSQAGPPPIVGPAPWKMPEPAGDMAAPNSMDEPDDEGMGYRAGIPRQPMGITQRQKSYYGE